MTFPNDLLVVPPSKVEPDGTISTNNSVAELLLGPTSDDVQLTRAAIGKYFFQSSYLTVDFDSQIFTISHAVPVTDSRLVSLGGECSSPERESSRTITKPHGAQTSGAQSSGVQSQGQALSTGALVGIVVAGASAATLITLCGLLCLLSRHKAKSEKNGSENVATARNGAIDFAGYTRFQVFQEAMSKNLVELQARRSRTELAAEDQPVELTTNRASQVRREKYLQGLNFPVELE